VTDETPATLTRAQRKPRLLFCLEGSFLLRLADRAFAALLLKLPPRFTRADARDAFTLGAFGSGREEEFTSRREKGWQELRAIARGAAA